MQPMRVGWYYAVTSECPQQTRYEWKYNCMSTYQKQ
jgi:hypothetical protein